MGDYDEWDGQGSFAQFAIAGSMAGLAEHSVIFPLDTIKTIMQARQGPVQALSAEGAVAGRGLMAGHAGGVMASGANLMSSGGGMLRMWHGVQTMFTGCVPAHAAYFSVYESSKAALSGSWPGAAAEGSQGGGSPSAAGPSSSSAAPDDGGAAGGSPFAAGAAVAVATMVHDVIMTPMDCIKQRLQLGHHRNCMQTCARAIYNSEGCAAFVISYPTTLVMNVPYGLIMGTSNEALRNVLNPTGQYSLVSNLLAGAGAGMLAAAVTNPLDVVKTRLQTQKLCMSAPAVAMEAAPKRAGAAGGGGPLAYEGLLHTAQTLLREEGAAAFARGVQPRMMIHACSVAICWGTYESVKHLLVTMKLFE